MPVLLDRPADPIAPTLLPGSVWLVGAGPGDPELLTVRATRALQAADSVFHDALPGPGVLALVGRRARLVDVGKRKGYRPWSQAAISAALIDAARSNERVVRLKGGDPLLFGRAGEEMAALSAAGIAWRIVPGVSAATAAPAVAGLSLTLRGVARSVTYVTCHDRDGLLPESLDGIARALAAAGDATLVAFMGLSRLDALSIRLLAAGWPDATPVAVIGRATLPGEVVLRTTLGACTLATRRAEVPTPALIVVGAVAAQADAMTEIVAREQPVMPIALTRDGTDR